MSPAQRKLLSASVLDPMRAAADVLEALAEELQLAFDDKSDQWQRSERGDAAQEEITDVEEALAQVEEAVSILEPLTERP